MLVRTEHLTKEYGGFRALDDLNLGIPPGEVFGLLGPNGSGKTTALRLLLGFIRPTSGKAWVGGHECWGDSVAVRRQVAYLPGELRLYENMTGRQLVHFLSKLRGHPVHAELDDLAKRFDIDLERPLANMSSGMKRKVALLQLLVAHATLLVMDEPTNALDPTMRQELLHQVKEARQRGQTVLFSSHVLTEVEEVCDRVGILRQGKLVHLQRIDQLREGRVIRVRSAKLLPDLPPFEGVTLRSREPTEMTLEATGPLPELLGWLAQQPVTHLQVEPLGLSGVYHQYHGAPQ